MHFTALLAHGGMAFTAAPSKHDFDPAFGHFYVMINFIVVVCFEAQGLLSICQILAITLSQ